MSDTPSKMKKAKSVAGQLLIVFSGTLAALLVYEYWRSRKVKAPSTSSASSASAAPATAPA